MLLQGDHAPAEAPRGADGCWRWRMRRSARSARRSKIFEEWLDEEPDDPIARHMLAACTGRDVPARASNGFVERTFDSFAASFESKLEQAVVSRARRWWRDDGGCGPRTVEAPRRARRRLRHGPVRPVARALRAPAGRRRSVDGMLARAKEKQVYDALNRPS